MITGNTTGSRILGSSQGAVAAPGRGLDRARAGVGQHSAGAPGPAPPCRRGRYPVDLNTHLAVGQCEVRGEDRVFVPGLVDSALDPETLTHQVDAGGDQFRTGRLVKLGGQAAAREQGCRLGAPERSVLALIGDNLWPWSPWQSYRFRQNTGRAGSH